MRVPGGQEPCWPSPSPGVPSEGLRVDNEQMEGRWGGRQSAAAGLAQQACAVLSIHEAGRPRPTEGDVSLCGLLTAPLGVCKQTILKEQNSCHVKAGASQGLLLA